MENDIQGREAQKRLLDIMADSPTLVKLGDNEWEIRDLRSYSRIKIAEVFTKIETTDSSVQNIILKEATNLKYSAEIVAIVLLNHTFTEDVLDNEKRIKQMTTKVLLGTVDENQWVSIILQAVNSLNIESVFTITALAKVISTSLLTRKKKIQEQSQSMQQQKSDE